jgi:DNA-binding transcriptional ArsR family regulator
MVVDLFAEKADLLNVIANAQRLRMLTVLSDGEMSVGPLAEHLGMSQSALSQHLAKLRLSKLVKTRREAQTVFYSINSPKVVAILHMLTRVFDEDAHTTRRLAG